MTHLSALLCSACFCSQSEAASVLSRLRGFPVELAALQKESIWCSQSDSEVLWSSPRFGVAGQIYSVSSQQHQAQKVLDQSLTRWHQTPERCSAAPQK